MGEQQVQSNTPSIEDCRDVADITGLAPDTVYRHLSGRRQNNTLVKLAFEEFEAGKEKLKSALKRKYNRKESGK